MDTEKNTPTPEAVIQAPSVPKKRFFKILLLTVAALVLLLLITGLALGFGCKIPADTELGDVDISGLNLVQAHKALTQALDETLYAQTLTIDLPEDTISLSPGDSGVHISSWKAVWNARKGGSISLDPFLTVKEEAVRAPLEAYAAAFDTDLTQPSYELQGQRPALDAAGFDPDAPGQVLALHMGIPERKLDIDQAYADIISAYRFAVTLCRNQNYRVIIRVPVQAVPGQPDLESIYTETTVAAVNDTIDKESYTVIPGSYGYGFGISAAQQLVNAAEEGETIMIPLHYEKPEIFGEEVYFQDVLGSCETVLNTNENRNNNLRKVCEILNGMIIQPGEEFSYNDTIGERTKERGFFPAPAYAGNTLVDSIGGGVCQGSSTLYYCCLLADLEVTDRINHGYVARYLPMGMDATVNWNGPDYKFRNNTHFPIKIQAEVSDGYVKMKLLGVDEKDYYIEMEYKITGYPKYANADDHGYYVKTYKNKFDKVTGELISSDFEANSSYRG